jgi:hypothetical protein
MNNHSRILTASTRLLVLLCFTATSVLCGTAHAQSTSGYQLSGNFDLPVSYNSECGCYLYTGGSVDASATVPITANVTFSASSGNWSTVGDWGFTNGTGLALADSLITAYSIVNGARSALDLNFTNTIQDINNSTDILENSGPTQKSVSIGLGSFSITGMAGNIPISGTVGLSVTPTINFNVAIPGEPAGTPPQQVIIDQPTINLLSLYVGQNATVVANDGVAGASFIINQSLVNEGTINNLWGTVSGEFSNSGNADLGGLGATLQLNGLLNNSGNVVAVGDSSLNVSGGITNSGNLTSTGGTISISDTTPNSQSNSGTIGVTDGGSLTLSGTLLQVGGGTLSATNNSAVNLDNGTISGGILNFDSSSALTVNGAGTLTGVTSNALINVTNLSTLEIQGGLTDNGTIVLNSNQGGGYEGTTAVLNVNGGTISGTGDIVLEEGSGCNGGLAYCGSGTGEVSGSLTQGAGHTISGIGLIDATLTNDGTVNANMAGNTLEFVPPNGTTTLTTTNNGLMESTSGGVLQFDSGVTLTNNAGATLNADGSTVSVSSAELTNLSAGVLTGGIYSVENGGQIILPENVTTNDANVVISGSGSKIDQLSLLANNDGALNVVGDGTLTTTNSMNNSGQVDVGAPTGSPSASELTVSGQYTQTAGSTTVDGTLSASGGISIYGGTLGGSGSVIGNVFNGGTVNPGDPTTLTVDGNYTQGPNGLLLMDISSASDFAMLDVTGNSSLAGTAEFDFLDGFVPTGSTSFGFLTASNISGNFNSVDFSGLDCLQCSIGFNSTNDMLTLEVSDASPIVSQPGTSTSAPEPGTLSLFAAGVIGLIGLIGISRKRRRTHRGRREAAAKEFL